jgi:CubicO group peptidase (beta-lactamase class C family)
VQALRQVDGWPSEHAAVAVAGAIEARHGDVDRVFPWLSVTKPAFGLESTLEELVTVALELLAPTRVSRELLAEAATVQFPGLDGVLPGFGRMAPNDWGLGFELRDAKHPHWTGSRNSPRTFGHFGRSGTFLWVDPDRGLALACLTDLAFGDWAKDAWPRLADAVLA